MVLYKYDNDYYALPVDEKYYNSMLVRLGVFKSAKYFRLLSEYGSRGYGSQVLSFAVNNTRHTS